MIYVPISKSTFALNEQLIVLRNKGTFVWEVKERPENVVLWMFLMRVEYNHHREKQEIVSTIFPGFPYLVT